jgi:hypothetical protein
MKADVITTKDTKSTKDGITLLPPFVSFVLFVVNFLRPTNEESAK